MATAAEIAAAAAAAAEDGVQSASVDGNSAMQLDPMKQLDVADRIEARSALTGSNASGGAKSGWRMLRPAQALPPGGV